MNDNGVIVIRTDSEAFRELARCFADPTTYKVSINVRKDGLATKRNEQMWSPTLNLAFSSIRSTK